MSKRRPLKLRTRLLAVVLGLFALVSLIVGTTTAAVYHHYLLGKLDSQLAGAETRGGYGPGGNRPGGAGLGDSNNTYGGGCGASGGVGPAGLFMPGQQVGTIIVTYHGGSLTYCGRITDNGTGASLTTAQTTALGAVHTDRSYHTISVPGLGTYRVTATREDDGDTVVTGLPLSDVNDSVLRLVLVELLVFAGGLMLVGLGAATVIRLQLRPLDRVAATATRVTKLELDRGEVALAERVPAELADPNTEVGQVGAALNNLLGHVDAALTARHESETQVRQFVADASHELRTPLAAIRGYAELTRRGREQAPPDIAHALTRVESEATRMTALVEDLLLLARLDSGRPLEVAPVDLSSLVIDTVSDAHAAGPDHDWGVDLPDEAVEVPGDGARLHQVLANLLANARTHTPPGTPVTVGLRVVDGSAVLTVTDEGPGIPAELLPTVFERFARGDSSRARAAGSSSTGLGLAIVSAVVAAHGGTVGVESRPGRTVFTVTLPASHSPAPVPVPA